MLQIIAEAPQPTLVIDGHRAIISNVRFTHMAHCPWCRNAYHVATDGGTIRMGIDANNPKKPRWHEKEKAGAAPTAPAACPNCGKEIGPHTYWYDGLPVYLARNLMNEAWTTIRATHPQLSGPADRAAGIV